MVQIEQDKIYENLKLQFFIIEMHQKSILLFYLIKQIIKLYNE